MDRIVEFTLNHPLLVSAAFFVIAMIIVTELRRARGVKEINANDAVRLMNDGAVIFDVRQREQFDSGHIINAKNFPLSTFEQVTEKLGKFKQKSVIVCCETGAESGRAAKTLGGLGFSSLVNLRGGLRAWREENLPLVKK